MIKFDLIIKNGIILSMDKDKKIYEKGFVAILDGKIKEIGVDLPVDFRAKKNIDAEGGIIMPGLVNTHVHAAMSLLRGYADDLPLSDWLEKNIWPAEARFMDRQTARLGVELAILEMISFGTTTFNDMYFFADETAEVANKIGIRAIVGEPLLDFSTPNCKTPRDAFGYSKALIKKWKGNKLISVAIAPHSIYACSEEILIEAKEMAEKYDALSHIHLAETAIENDKIKGRSGLSPVAYLEKIGFLNGRVIAAHCVYLSEEDIKILAKNHVGIAHNPESNMKLSSGVAPIVKLLEADVNVGLGTDGAASNNNLDLVVEMESAARLQKLNQDNPAVLVAERVVEMATLGGARVLGLEKEIGSLERGKKADIIIIDLNKPHLIPIFNPYSLLVYAAGGADVSCVIINGRIIMENREFLTADVLEIITKAKEKAEKIKTIS